MSGHEFLLRLDTVRFNTFGTDVGYMTGVFVCNRKLITGKHMELMSVVISVCIPYSHMKSQNAFMKTESNDGNPTDL